MLQGTKHLYDVLSKWWPSVVQGAQLRNVVSFRVLENGLNIQCQSGAYEAEKQCQKYC